MPVWEQKAEVFEVQDSLLRTGYEGAYPRSDAVFRAENAVPSPVAGTTARDRQTKA